MPFGSADSYQMLIGKTTESRQFSRRLRRLFGRLRFYKVWCFCATLLFCFLALLVCVSAQTEFPFESARPLYVGARALAMGNAFTAVADDATAGFWNPAGLIQWQGVKLFGVNKFHDRQDYRFDPKGIGYSWRGYSLFWGNKIALGVESGVPDFNYYAIASQFGAYTAVGASLKFKRRHPADYYQFFGYQTAYDIGLLFKPRKGLKFGCLAQNLYGYGIQWVTLGTAYRYSTYQFSADVALSTVGETPGVYFGAEWTPFPIVSLRLGSSNGSLTGGIGITWKTGRTAAVHISYARIFEKRFASDFIAAELHF